MVTTLRIHAAPVDPADTRRLPGEAGLWLVIAGDVLVFSLFFGLFVYDLGVYPEMFHESQSHLNRTLAAVNTILLLTSSWLVVTAVAAARKNMARSASFCLGSAFFCGLGFCVIKFVEYREKFLAGLAVNTNEFWTLYFMYTGIHLAHVLIGLGVLTFMVRVCRKSEMGEKELSHLESGASYWHMVDLLWIGLFGLLYFLK